MKQVEMTETEIEKLKEKLTKWAGFEKTLATDGKLHWFDEEQRIISPTDSNGNCVFPDSLDACFKWLVPEVLEKIMELFKINKYGAWQTLFAWWYQEITKLPNEPALALCLALEKLIDTSKEEK